MRFPSVKANLGLLASSALTLALAACGPAQESATVYTLTPSASTKISALTETGANCEEKIRGQMLARTPLLQDLPGIEKYIADLNNPPVLEKRTYALTQQRKQFSSVIIKNSHLAAADYRAYNYELGLNDSGGIYPIYLEVDATQAGAQNALEIKQRFNVADGCELRLVSTFISQTRPDAKAGDYTTTETTFFVNGEKNQAQSRVTLPGTQTVADFRARSGDLSTMKDGMKIYANGVLTTLKITTEADQTFQDFAKPVILNIRTFRMVAPDGRAVMEMVYGADPSLRILFEQSGIRKKWTVPQEMWSQTSLGTARLDDQTVVLEWPAQYLQTHNSFRLLAAKTPSYDHLAAYWNLQTTGNDAKTGLLSFVATENKSATTAGNFTAEDLISNDTIQTRLPQIQKIAQDILRIAPKDRRQQVALILKYLKDHYEYDRDMVNENTVRPLTTAEALSRGKGVCQHYSVIFTSIARALGIPTRIVMGYGIWGTRSVGHAWVESQLDAGRWQVIEPQNANGLRDTLPRNYLPLMRATMLEDKNSNSRDYISVMMESTFVLRAL